MPALRRTFGRGRNMRLQDGAGAPGRYKEGTARPGGLTDLRGGETVRVGLHDAEQDYLKHKKFPNYALMKISAYHKARGDSVEWWSPMLQYDLIYSSKVFDFTPESEYLPPSAIRGGTGYPDIPINQTLPPEIDAAFPDYSIYPECDYAIGYLTRGCPNHCPWCVVPAKDRKSVV